MLYETNGAGAITKKTDGTLETTYHYEPSGDRVDWADVRDTISGATARTNFSYNLFGDLTDITPPAGAPAEHYDYDGFERQTNWSKTGATPISYTYDALDRRDTRTQGSNTTNYAYLGSTEKLSREESTGGKTQFFDYDSSLDRIGRAEQTSTQTPSYQAYTTDANGSVESLENDDGTAAESYTYDPFGMLLSDARALRTRSCSRGITLTAASRPMTCRPANTGPTWRASSQPIASKGPARTSASSSTR